MRLAPAESLHRIDSIVRRLPAGVKAGTVVLCLLGIAAVPLRASILLVIPLGVSLTGLVLSRIPPVFILRRMLLLEPFALAASALALFRPEGWEAFWVLLAKSSLSLSLVVLLAATTPFSHLLAEFRRLHVPGLLVTTIALLYRYLFLLADQVERMRRARASRTFLPGRRRAWFLAAGMIGHLVVRSMERAERVYAAMRARGWE